MLTRLCIVFLLISTVLNSDPEDHYRRLIKQQNRLMVDAHNSDPSNQYEMKLYDRFSGYTFQEL